MVRAIVYVVFILCCIPCLLWLTFICAMSGYDIPTTGAPGLALIICLGFVAVTGFISRHEHLAVHVLAMTLGFIAGLLVGAHVGQAPLPEKFAPPEHTETLQF